MADHGSTEVRWSSDLGAFPDRGKIRFKVWAPKAKKVAVKIVSPEAETVMPLAEDHSGYFIGSVDSVSAGDRYFYVVDDMHQFPDPASRFQPEGVHGPSEVVDPSDFPWQDGDWKGRALQDLIIYELHTGAFTPEGTFQSIVEKLDYLLELGINAIELMPVAQFSGTRNWGYDGVYPFAPQNSYGGPRGLKKLVDACHRRGLSVVLDVVYNHLGPEGNYLDNFGYYFTSKYRTPWGDALNFDGPYSDEVRRYFIDNALYWLTEYHIDALRVDAVHAIYDFSARHFLHELADTVRGLKGALNRQVFLIAESDLNDARVISPPGMGGYGLDAQWNDDFHHALHALITNEHSGYYEDFGKVGHLEKSLREGYVYTGQYSLYRRRSHGNSSKARPADQFVVFSQSHDQVGNRVAGDRLSQTLPFEKLKLAAGAVILSPFIPLLFMGEEYGEAAPFPYFISHSDPGLAEAVREGRRKEFASFGWKGAIPDPQDEKIFFSSKLTFNLSGQGKALYGFYRELIRLRKEISVLCHPRKEDAETRCFEDEKALSVRRWRNEDQVFGLYNFGERVFSNTPEIPAGTWEKILDSSSPGWGGSGSAAPGKIRPDDRELSLSLAPYSFVLYRMCKEGS